MKKYLFALLVGITALAVPYFAGAQNIYTYAGSDSVGYSGDGGPAVGARLNRPYDIVCDGANNIYFADVFNNRIRKITPGGIITTIAGNGSGGSYTDGVPATSAAIDTPIGICLGPSNRLYFCERRRVRMVDLSTGIITTVAGNGALSATGDGGPATAASLDHPESVVADNAGNVYIGGTTGHIRKVSAAGIITNFAGSDTGTYPNEGGQASATRVMRAFDMAFDKDGNLYYSENSRIRRIHPSGIVTTVAGTGSSSYSGDGGPATSAGIGISVGFTIDASGNLVFADRINHYIRTVNLATGLIATLAGTGVYGYNGDGIPATTALLNAPRSVTHDTYGNYYVSDFSNARIRRIGAPLAVGDVITGNFTASVSPNPSKAGAFTLSMLSSINAPAKVVITDAVGRKVKTLETTTNDTTPIQLNAAPGVYFIAVSTAHGVWNEKVVVE